MTVLAIVPARGGSKTIPRKNIVPLCGTPLIAYTLRAAAAARTIDRIVVSTDDDAIAAVARAEGAEVVERPAELAADDSPTEAALNHVLDMLESRGEELPEFVVTLEPTAPLRRPETIDRCVELAVERGADAVLTVTEVTDSLGRVHDGVFALLDPSAPRRRQLRTPLYRESGTVWVTRASVLRETRSVLAEPLYPVVVPREEAIDVNDPVDVLVAEALLERRNG